MLKFALRRLLLIIPFLLFVMYSLFVLTTHFPIDPVLQSLENQGVDSYVQENIIASPIYLAEKERLGLDKPPFYMSIVPSEINRALPSVNWHGRDNQYHHWMGRLFSLDFGQSAKDGKNAGSKTVTALGYTLKYMVPCLTLTYCISILLGIFIGRNPEHWMRRVLSTKLYVLSAVPLFWLATLSMMFLTTPLYSKWLDIFPRVDVIVGSSYPIQYYVLPVIILTTHSLAYLTIQVKNLFVDQVQLPYVTGLKARGIKPSAIERKHLLKNIMVPLTTLFTKSIPTTIAGSIVLEQIFNLPGIGRLLLKSIQSSDWNVTVPIICVIGIVTVLSYLLADILYYYFDPRIKATHS